MKMRIAVRRTDVRASIRFEGLIRGCADYQWLIADALWEVGAGPTLSLPQRWVVTSHEPDADVAALRFAHSLAGPSFPHRNDPARLRIVAYDRLTGWTASAASAEEIADLILQAYRDRPMTALPITTTARLAHGKEFAAPRSTSEAA